MGTKSILNALKIYSCRLHEAEKAGSEFGTSRAVPG